MDESKQKFEKWFDEHMFIGSKCIADPATKRRMFCAWIAAWQASREAIEIKLDDKVMVEDEFDKGHNCAIDYCAEAIRAAGIKVKE
ncbi:hypothetical protein OI984_01745 [Enterobacter roggenkampii]|uniref:hypothetical protein n=1 Tax=Enterobacter roggenkampii TaxID=1812935 RepID=UPI002542B193|nr:hypothetical protein [Enterobacter roggenkampii]WIJ49637.1 hypothetical protein OI984_01745 [Enterobacter roggenkampii]